jgi:hypothetical protein
MEGKEGREQLSRAPEATEVRIKRTHSCSRLELSRSGRMARNLGTVGAHRRLVRRNRVPVATGCGAVVVDEIRGLRSGVRTTALSMGIE